MEWRPPIVRTQATTGEGLDALDQTIARFREHGSSVEVRRRKRAEAQLRSIVGAKLLRQVETRVSAIEMETLIDRIAARSVDPYSAADEVIGAIEPRHSEATAGTEWAGSSSDQ